MEVTNTMGAGELVRKYLEADTGSDLLAAMVKMAAELLMDADVDCSVARATRSAPSARTATEPDALGGAPTASSAAPATGEGPPRSVPTTATTAPATRSRTMTTATANGHARGRRLAAGANETRSFPVRCREAFPAWFPRFMRAEAVSRGILPLRPRPCRTSTPFLIEC